ncbi:MAG: hypothetical protein IJ439_04540 [Tyzzerella sp.]|nr:hypothetical protein [Tyzzerella sp.]
MKKILSKSLFMIAVLVLIMSCSMTAFAAGTVTYDGNAKKFIFEPGSKYSPTDLFTDFKDVMPGDSITQKVHIKNDVSNNVKIKLYMRSLGAHEDSKEFLSKLQLRVSQDGTSNLFDAPADQTAQLADWVYLGTFYSGAEIDLNVTLDVPIELGNEYQNAIGYLDWQFKVEELPVESSDPNPPQTGDTTNLSLYVAVACVTGIVLVVLIGRRHGKSNRETI